MLEQIISTLPRGRELIAGSPSDFYGWNMDTVRREIDIASDIYGKLGRQTASVATVGMPGGEKPILSEILEEIEEDDSTALFEALGSRSDEAGDNTFANGMLQREHRADSTEAVDNGHGDAPDDEGGETDRSDVFFSFVHHAMGSM
eukprot:SAG31_NODE_4443_length_3226_cov_2.036776_2_plen_146_part_00